MLDGQVCRGSSCVDGVNVVVRFGDLLIRVTVFHFDHSGGDKKRFISGDCWCGCCISSSCGTFDTGAY